LQQAETILLKKRIKKFEDKVKSFRNEFLSEAPFGYDPHQSLAHNEKAYTSIDTYYVKLRAIMKEAEDFNSLENLFELELTKYKALRDCEDDIIKLKSLWDLINMINYSYESWTKTIWKDIETDKFSGENDQFIFLLKKQVREVKLLKGFKTIEEKCLDMKKILGCISNLTSVKMSDRHWGDLSKQIGCEIDYKNPNFCFNDMVTAKINLYELQVQELTDIATKEGKIEKSLFKVKSDWENKAFEFEAFNQAGEEIQIFRPFVIIEEDLSTDNQKILSLLSQGKSVDHFRTDLDTIRVQLQNIENTITVWGKVQKNWKRLVNIFLLSDDIRNQLPEATKLFDEKNNQFRDIMRDVVLNPIIKEVCTPEIKVVLDEICRDVEDCEKKLNIYLEQKKKIFPRFYFVSNQTLIDILSNGNNPIKISQEYLGDLFEGISKLKLRENDKGELTPFGLGMFSKENEYIEFSEVFDPAKEQVERWLLGMEFAMRQSLEASIGKAKEVADEYLVKKKFPADQAMDWIFAFCAQIALLTTQIIWTGDVHVAFDDLEGGMSNAMKDCLEGINKRITLLITKVRGNLAINDRIKIITIITIDVHSRDVVKSLLR
jgi:dynein heavy chain, axonemal